MKCKDCGKETEHYDWNIPRCLDCISKKYNLKIKEKYIVLFHKIENNKIENEEMFEVNEEQFKELKDIIKNEI